MLLMLILAAASASAFHVHDKSPVLDFEYKWPSQASTIPRLRRQLIARMNHDRARYAKMAEVDRRDRAAQSFPFHPYAFSRTLHFGGGTKRLVSFADERYAFTGGAHGDPSTQPLLWDLKPGKIMTFAELSAKSPKALIQPGYCKQLARQRIKKNGMEPPNSGWEKCPDPLKLSVILEDKDRNGRFETINVTANPYDVGSYAEGYYIVMLPVTSAVMRLLKPQYRSSFEAQRQ